MKQLLGVGVWVAFMAATAYFWWPISKQKLAADNFECSFDAKSTENMYSFGGLKLAVKSISLKGYIDDPFDGVLYDLSGDAVVLAGTDSIAASARGSVFIDENGEPRGLLLVLENENFLRPRLASYFDAQRRRCG